MFVKMMELYADENMVQVFAFLLICAKLKLNLERR